MSDIDNIEEDRNGASMMGGLTGPVSARIEDAHFYKFGEDDIPQNMVIKDVASVAFDDEDCVIVTLKSGRTFNIVWDWVEDDL